MINSGAIIMNTAEKELLKLVTRMTEDEWRQLRADMKADEKIMRLLDFIGAQKGWK